MRYFCSFLFCLCVLLPSLSADHTHHVTKGTRYVGLTESGGANRSAVIDGWNRGVGVPYGSPYCAAFVSAVLSEARCLAITTRSARARAFINERRGQVIAVHQNTKAQPGDVVIVTGKGHERYQEIRGVRHPFSDVQAAKQCLDAWPAADAPRSASDRGS